MICFYSKALTQIFDQQIDKRNTLCPFYHKARYFAKDYEQKFDKDYFDTFALAVKMTAIRVYLQIAVQFNLRIYQMDEKTTYLNAPIDVQVYVKQPEGFIQKIEGIILFGSCENLCISAFQSIPTSKSSKQTPFL